MSQYSKLAPHYRALSERKKAYIEAVNRLIFSYLPGAVDSVLDVGSADGVRGLALAHKMAAKQIVLCEPCAEMAALCRRNAAGASHIRVLECDGLALHALEEKYDVVLCLWNVLGHVPNNVARAEMLKVLGRRLKPGGRLFLDVNNRHNAVAYGAFPVLGRRILDALFFDERRGDAEYMMQIGEELIPSHGHLFTPQEMARLFASAGLTVCQRKTVNYLSGTISNNAHQGQLFYVLEAQ